MRLIFACTVNNPWPGFLLRERVREWLMSYFQLQEIGSPDQFWKASDEDRVRAD